MRLKQFIKKKRNLLIAIAIFIVAVFLIDLTPFGGNTRVYVKWIQCGSRPVSGSGGWFSEVPHYDIYTAKFGILRGWPDLFCSPREAELAGYSANRLGYEFPHLSGDDLKNAYFKATHGGND